MVFSQDPTKTAQPDLLAAVEVERLLSSLTGWRRPRKMIELLGLALAAPALMAAHEKIWVKQNDPAEELKPKEGRSPLTNESTPNNEEWPL